MSRSSFFFLVATGLALGAFASGCGAPDVDGSNYGRRGQTDEPTTKKKTTTGGDDDDAGPAPPQTQDTGDVDTNPTTTPPGTTTTPPIADADKDGVADSVDCAPNNANIAGTTLLVDDLTTDKGFFTVPQGFPAADWTYSDAFRQTRLAQSPDITILNKDPNVSEAIVSVTAASTEITSTITPILRQMFITFGTTMNAGVLSAVGCGLEVDASQTVTQKTSVSRLSGSPNSISASPLNRVDRGAVQANELFQMKATLRGTTLTCEVTIGGATTTTATASVGPMKGSIGLYTNQTKALFKQINVCKLNK